MIVENNNRSVATNLSNSMEFSVSENSSKLFSLLSDSLYSDKPRAVITELSSNAFDAHKLVKKGHIPFEIQLPTQLVPEIRIRDFGPGMSESDVYQFLTKFGASSKDGSNDYVGGFGIGSKAPAAVTDSWEIKSHNNGTMSQYLIHVNDQGIPSINKVFSTKSDETGLEVIIPAKPNSYDTWFNAAAKTYQFYKTMPIIKGTSRTINKFIPTKEHELFISGVMSTAILVNHRAYNLNIQLFPDVDARIMNCNFMLPFNIGEISIGLSREDLQYNKKTTDAINKRFEDIKIALSAMWKSDVSGSNNIIDYQLAAAKFIYENKISIGCATLLGQLNGDNFRVKMNWLSYFTIDVPNRSKVAKFDGRYREKSGVEFDYSCKIASFVYVDGDRFVLNDIRNIRSRCEQQSTDAGNLFIVEQELFDLIPDCFAKVKASDLPYTPPHKKTRAVREKSEIYIRCGKVFEPYDEAKLDITQPIVCVKFTNMRSLNSIIGDKIASDIFKSVRIIGVRGKDEIPSYAITPMQFAKMELNKAELELPSIIAYIKKSRLGSDWVTYALRAVSPEMRTKFPSAFNKCADGIKGILDYSTGKSNYSYDRYLELCQYVHGETNTAKQVDTPDFRSIMLEQYPMLQYWNSSIDNIQIMIDYVNLVGK